MRPQTKDLNHDRSNIRRRAEDVESGAQFYEPCATGVGDYFSTQSVLILNLRMQRKEESNLSLIRIEPGLLTCPCALILMVQQHLSKPSNSKYESGREALRFPV